MSNLVTKRFEARFTTPISYKYRRIVDQHLRSKEHLVSIYQRPIGTDTTETIIVINKRVHI